MSLRLRLIATSVIAVVVVALLGATLVWRSAQVGRITSGVLGVYQPASVDASTLEMAVSDMQRGLGSFLLTGLEADLRPYVNGSRRSELALGDLRRELSEEPGLLRRVNQVELDRVTWINAVAQPAIADQRAGDSEAALATYTAGESRNSFEQLRSDAAELRSIISDRRNQGFRELADVTGVLQMAVAVSLLVLAAGLVAIWFLVSNWILKPLDSLRRQMRSVGRRGEHHTPIAPTGPPELTAVGRDAESMRRKLVAEIDEARSAREALDQNAPVVAAIRRELSAGAALRVPGLSVHGDLRPAEGVLAGDWWDATRLPDGRVAVLLTDISGHGAEAGIAAMRIKHTITHGLISGQSAPEAVAASAETFADDPGRFATTVALLIEPGSGELTWVNAGHHEPMLLRAGGELEHLGKTGPLLSWLGGRWTSGGTTLQVGDRVLLFSDGLVESHDHQGGELGDRILGGWLQEAPSQLDDPAELVAWLLGQARSRAVDWDRDDVTIVAISRTPATVGAPAPAPATTPAAAAAPPPETPSEAPSGTGSTVGGLPLQRPRQ